jgi:hypothetical protein
MPKITKILRICVKSFVNSHPEHLKKIWLIDLGKNLKNTATDNDAK